MSEYAIVAIVALAAAALIIAAWRGSFGGPRKEPLLEVVKAFDRRGERGGDPAPGSYLGTDKLGGFFDKDRE